MLQFRYKEDRLPVLAVTLLFLGSLAVWALVDRWQFLAIWFFVCLVPRGGAAAYNHHHQHLNTFKDTLSNRVIEMIYGLLTGIVSHLWVLHHSVGHHVNYLDQKTDESRWQRQDGTTMGEMEYVFVGSVAAYSRAWTVGGRFKRYRRTMLWMSGLTIAILAVMTYFRPLQTVAVFIFPMIFGLCHTVWATYTHHTGLPTDSHYVASNNIIHRGYNLLTGNLGYHTAHHTKPGMHWSRLPEFHSQIAHLIPAHCYITPGFPFKMHGQRVVGPPSDMPSARPLPE